MKENTTTIVLTDDEAKLFLEFQKHFQIIAYVLGAMALLNINIIKNASLTLDYDQNGKINHSVISQHYR